MIRYIFRPYNYDVDKVMNLTNDENSDRKTDSEVSAEIMSIDKYFETVSDDNSNVVTSQKIFPDDTTKLFQPDQLEKPELYLSDIIDNDITLDDWKDFEPSTLIVEDPEVDRNPSYLDLKNYVGYNPSLFEENYQKSKQVKDYMNYNSEKYPLTAYDNQNLLNQNIGSEIYQKKTPPFYQTQARPSSRDTRKPPFPSISNIKQNPRFRKPSSFDSSYNKPTYNIPRPTPSFTSFLERPAKSSFTPPNRFHSYKTHYQTFPSHQRNEIPRKPFRRKEQFPPRKQPYRRQFF